ncbi:MAG: VWA domain-containing protein [Candidatus Acidiferrales bacterium]
MRRFCLFALTCLLALPATSQQPPSPPRPEGPGYRVRVKVEIVAAPVVVRDQTGEFVYDIRRDEVEVFDNGQPQQLSAFELASAPVSLVLLLNTSQRVAPLLERVKPSGVLFSSYVMGQNGEAAVITFDDEITVRQEFSGDVEKLVKTVSQVQAGGSKARLADALDQAVALLVERPQGRRGVIVVVSEARDEGSEVPIGIPLRSAQLAGISVYTIALNRTEAIWRRRPEETPVKPSPYPPGVSPMPPLPGQVQTPTTETQRQQAGADIAGAVKAVVTTLSDTLGQNVLEVYAQGSGGQSFEPSSREEFEAAINLIGQDLHNQYLVSYRPSNRDQEGFHRLEVRVNRPGVQVRTRAGYYVGPPL